MNQQDRAPEQPFHPVRPTVYQSAVDLWVVLLLVMTPLLAAAIGVHLFLDDRPGDAAILFLTGAATLVVSAAFTIPCRYTLLQDALSVRCGILFYQIPLEEIETVEPSTSLRSGPALSLQRVLITTAKRKVILSPQDREAFIADLRQAIEEK